jgi:hypothetical protein
LKCMLELAPLFVERGGKRAPPKSTFLFPKDLPSSLEASSLRLDNRALLGVGNSCAPDLLLVKSGSGELNHIIRLHGNPAASSG